MVIGGFPEKMAAIFNGSASRATGVNYTGLKNGPRRAGAWRVLGYYRDS